MGEFVDTEKVPGMSLLYTTLAGSLKSCTWYPLQKMDDVRTPVEFKSYSWATGNIQGNNSLTTGSTYEEGHALAVSGTTVACLVESLELVSR